MLTEIGVKQYADVRTRQKERGTKPPYFWHRKLKDPWQVENNTTAIKYPSIDEYRLHGCQSCQSPTLLASKSLPCTTRREEGLEVLRIHLDTGGAAQNASISVV